MSERGTVEASQTPKAAIAGLALFSIALHLAFYNNLEYHRDELLYFSLGRHPAWGYASVPPLIAWLANGLQFLFG